MHPLLRAGPLQIHLYGLCVLAGMLFAIGLAVRRARVLGYDRLALFLWGCFGPLVGVMGGRAVPAIANVLHGRPAGFLSGESGMSATGAAIAGLVYTAIFTRVAFGEGPLKLLDAMAPAYPVMVAFGRLGCLFEGCCYGAMASSSLLLRPFSVSAGSYDPASDAGARYAQLGADARIWNFPLLLILTLAVVFLAAIWVERRAPRWSQRPGARIAFVIGLECALRFFVEFVREERSGWMGLTDWQFVTGAMAISAAVVLLVQARRSEASAPAADVIASASSR